MQIFRDLNLYLFKGGWRSRSDPVLALDPFYGASLMEGARGGSACIEKGAGGFGGGKNSLRIY